MGKWLTFPILMRLISMLQYQQIHMHSNLGNPEGKTLSSRTDIMSHWKISL